MSDILQRAFPIQTTGDDNDNIKEDSIISKKKNNGTNNTMKKKMVTNNNNMNSKINKQLKTLPDNLKFNGSTPSGKPRLFVCGVCTRAFARQEHLDRHERSHTKEKPYDCGICERKFSRRDLLLRHAQKVHAGNCGDTLLKRKKRVTRRKLSNNSAVTSHSSTSNSSPFSNSNYTTTTPLSSSSIENSTNGITKIRKVTKEIQLPSSSQVRKPKRRASFSAQSAENYTRIKFPNNIDNFVLNSSGEVQFSTPELLPVDFNHFFSDANLDPNANKEEDNDNAIFNNTDVYGIPTEFSLNDINPNRSNLFTIKDDDEFADPFNNLNNLNYFNYSDPQLQNVSPLTRASSTSLSNVIGKNNPNNENLNNVKDVMGNAGTPRDIMDTLMSTSTAVSTNTDSLNLIDGAKENENINITLDNIFDADKPRDNNDLFSFANYSQNIFNNFIKEEEDSNIMDLGNDERNATNNNNYTFYGIDYLALSNISKASPTESDPPASSSSTTPVNKTRDLFSSLPIATNNSKLLTKSSLFTPLLRNYCSKVMKYYIEKCSSTNNNFDPVVLTKDLLLPSCNELNSFLSLFRVHFLSHYPFIHSEILKFDNLSLQKYLTEDNSLTIADINYSLTQGETDILEISRTICLPLLMATFGSLYKDGCKPKTMILYEISRRAIHVFLESKKKRNSIALSGSKQLQHSQQTWLIQTLTLNIIFALFAEELHKINSDVVKRQVNAICSVVKANILADISIPIDNLKFNNRNNDIKLNNSFHYILFESKIKCTFMLYRCCQFLKIFYNINSVQFLSESNIENICIPDDEHKWNSISFGTQTNNGGHVTKQYSHTFKRFYNSFTFNDNGLHPIPESLATVMMFYEYNTKTYSPTCIFLTKIDNKKLDSNLPTFNTINDDQNEIYSRSIMVNDAKVLKNCLMSMTFFNEANSQFGSMIWSNNMNKVYDTFLVPERFNLLTNDSYELLTNFLVALNCSIQNVSRIFFLSESADMINLDKRKLSIFNLKGYYYNLLIIIKFLMDFETTPNFKLLCIFTDLNKLANHLMIPKFSELYPTEFSKFEDVYKVNTFWNNHKNEFGQIKPHYSSIDFRKIEKIINDVLIYSFNDASFLNMTTDQTNNEFAFNSKHLAYYPFDSPSFEEKLNENYENFDHNQNNNLRPSDSQINLLIDNETKKQSFGKRYHLSAKYIVIAKCLFMRMKESYAHCTILDKMITDFDNLEKIIDQKDNEKDLFSLHLTK